MIIMEERKYTFNNIEYKLVDDYKDGFEKETG